MLSWPLSGHLEDEVNVVLQDQFVYPDIQIDSGNGRLAVSAGRGRVLVSDLDGTGLRTLQGYSSSAVLHPVAFGDHGRLVAAAPYNGPKTEKVVRIWNLESGHVDVLGPLKGAAEGMDGGVWDIEFIDDQRLLLSGREGLFILNIAENKITLLSDKPHQEMALSRDHRFIVAQRCDSKNRFEPICQFVQFSLENNRSTILNGFGEGNRGFLALDSTGQILVTGSTDGLVRVGKMSGQEPHIIFGHKAPVYSVAVSPDGEWIASGEFETGISITPMPHLSKPAPHTLAHDLLLTKLKSFTNLRVVPNSQSATGWKVEIAHFPGWKDLPGW